MFNSLVLKVRGHWLESPTLRNIAKVWVGDGVSKVAAVASALILIRGLNTPDYALYVAFSGAAVLAAAVVGSGINTALVRFSSEHISRTGRQPLSLYVAALIVESAIFLLIFSIALAFPAKAATLLFGQPGFSQALQAGILLGFGLLLFDVGQRFYQSEQRFTLYIGVGWAKQATLLALLAGLLVAQTLTFPTVAWSIALLQVAVGLAIIAYGVSGGRPGTWASAARYQADPSVLLRDWLADRLLSSGVIGRMDVLMLSRLRQ